MKKKSLIVLSSILLIFFISGVTYAWFSANVIGNENGKGTVVETGTLSINYINSFNLEGNNIVPGWSESRTFTVTNTGTREAYYKIEWANVFNEFVNKNDLTYELTFSSNKNSEVTNIGEKILPGTGNNIEILSHVEILPEEVITFNLTVRYKNNGNQNSDIGKKFKGKIEVKSSNKVNEVFTLKGQATMDGQPISNGIVEIHSDVLTANTDMNGNYEVVGVPVGNHEIILKDSASKVLTSKNVFIYKAENNSANKNSISIGNESERVNLNINVNNESVNYQIINEPIKIFNKSISNPNIPKLDGNMIPVVYNSNKDVWVKAGLSQQEWYNYDEKIWANAVSVISSKREQYRNSEVGTEIPMGDILGMFVWIPRYKYAVPNGSGPREISIIFENNTQTTGTNLQTGTISRTINNLISSDYYTHPAFRNGKSLNYVYSGWDKELTGIWVGKFETSNKVGKTSNMIYTSNTTIKPNVQSSGYLNVFNHFNTSLSVSNQYGFGILKSHSMKVTEWGAIVGLSQSKFGRCSNGICEEIFSNHTLHPQGDPVCGCANTVINAPHIVRSTCLDGYSYKDVKGFKASTTKNIYGIYDLSGGNWESLMGIYKNIISNSGFSSMPDRKYYDLYNSTDGIKGDFTNKDGTAGWYADYAAPITSDMPYSYRGGFTVDTNQSGLFAFANNKGQSGLNVFGFRTVLNY